MSKRDMYEKIKIARKHALRREGYKFIELELLKSHMRRIQGIEVVNVIQSEDVDNPGKPRYDFNLGGGRLDFVMDANRGGLFDDIVDTPKNRKFLARHIDMKIWHIVDDKVRKEVEELSKKIAGEVFRPVNVSVGTEKGINTSGDDDSLTDPILRLEHGGDESAFIPEDEDNATKTKRNYRKKGAAIIEDTGNS